MESCHCERVLIKLEVWSHCNVALAFYVVDYGDFSDIKIFKVSPVA